MKSKYIKRFKKKFSEIEINYSDQINYIYNNIENNVMSNLYKGMKIENFLEKIIINFNTNKDNLVLKNTIINHGVRVYRNAIIIMNNLCKTKKMVFSDNDKKVIFIGCLLHDIGKLYSKENHHLYSTIIIDYILKKDNNMSKDMLNSILEIVFFHSSKNKRRDKISPLAKILRDADLFDENCGQSLLVLLVSNIKNKHNNLNFIDYTKSTRLLKEKMNPSYKAKIEEKINIESNKKLYNDLLWDAMSKYYEIIQPFECEQDNDLYYYNNIEI